MNRHEPVVVQRRDPLIAVALIIVVFAPILWIFVGLAIAKPGKTTSAPATATTTVIVVIPQAATSSNPTRPATTTPPVPPMPPITPTPRPIYRQTVLIQNVVNVTNVQQQWQGNEFRPYHRFDDDWR